MNSRWFANRGQMVQIALATVGAFVTLMVWFAIPPKDLPLLYLVAIVVLAFLMLGCVDGRLVVHTITPPNTIFPFGNSTASINPKSANPC